MIKMAAIYPYTVNTLIFVPENHRADDLETWYTASAWILCSQSLLKWGSKVDLDIFLEIIEPIDVKFHIEDPLDKAIVLVFLK